tara:strand:+ start:950 stop:1456 length:507 start_codon:yes stop_codon:yes gene_type:complete
MTNSANLRYTYDKNDFLSPHTKQEFPLGFLATVESDDGVYQNIYLYVKSGETTLYSYRPHQREAGFELIPIRDDTNYIPIFVPQFDIPPNTFAFVLLKGKGKANVRSGPAGVVNGTYFTPRIGIPEFFYGTNTNMGESVYGSALEPMNDGETKVIEVHMMGRLERLYG